MRSSYDVLGAQGFDPATKLKGTVDAITYNLTHTIQATIQPPSNGKELPKPYLIDLNTLKITNKLPTKKQVAVEDTNINLGDQVEDLISGFTGIVTQIHVNSNGCISVTVVAKCEKNNKEGNFIVLNHKRFKVLKAGAFVPQTVPTGAMRCEPLKLSA